jgi:tetratricopeptide (TPR) repeat protein
MAIEGPLRELGIHDVFQLLDLSRKTGMLRVSSTLREDEGVVYFDSGRVIQATIRSKPAAMEAVLLQAGRITEQDIERARERRANGRASREIAELLVESGAISAKELERHRRQQIESVVFDLMSWREGFFSFEERPRTDLPRDTRIAVSTESLLMEGARRIDEWSRIAEIVPNLSVVAELAPFDASREGATLDLLPHEWQVLTMIDGERDLRAMAALLGRDEFEVAKIAYGLATTGVISLRAAARIGAVPRNGDGEGDARLAVAQAHARAGRHAEAADELRRALKDNPLAPQLHLELGSAAVRCGDFAAARASWNHFLRVAPSDPEAARVTTALEALDRLESLLDPPAGEGRAHG